MGLAKVMEVGHEGMRFGKQDVWDRQVVGSWKMGALPDSDQLCGLG